MISSEYAELVQRALRQFFPDPFILELPGGQLIQKFDQHLPSFKWTWIRGGLKLHFICRHRLNVATFFSEMIQRWLLPGRRLDVSSSLSTDFAFHSAPQTLFTLVEMGVRIEPALAREQIEHNLRVIETEIRLGMISVYHASRLLETHFTSPQQKNSQIQEKITKLLERNPADIDFDIFGLVQRFLVMSPEEFKIHRSPTHLSRLMTATYLFIKSIERAREKQPDRHHVRLKISPVVLDLPWGPQEVTGICIALNLLNTEELFEERHLIKAIQKVASGAKIVSGSFYLHEGDVKVLYLEIENGIDLKAIKDQLTEEVKRAIEVPPKSLFMPRNEEEILRYIVALAGQLRFVKDLPQIILMFDEQKGGSLNFTVILVRILFPTSYSIQYLFTQQETILQFTPDRVKRVGLLRKKYPKEATVFRVQLSAAPFLRDDHSVDLFRARQTVFQELVKVVGELRDYTGGMLAKQVELLDQVYELMEEKDPQLEPFFHALYPVEARSFLQPQQIKNWFQLWKQLLEFPEDRLRIERDQSAVYIIGPADLIPEFDPADFGETQLISVRPENNGKYLGYLFVSSDIEEQQSFIAKFQSVVTLSIEIV